ncbi:hypothetical protein BC828DRAFT_162951 [Blastocladiella britannica]|nr:hypothetical protein BC828DRAFT_162951 [Blastocladiella britannica]
MVPPFPPPTKSTAPTATTTSAAHHDLGSGVPLATSGTGSSDPASASSGPVARLPTRTDTPPTALHSASSSSLSLSLLVPLPHRPVPPPMHAFGPVSPIRTAANAAAARDAPPAPPQSPPMQLTGQRSSSSSTGGADRPPIKRRKLWNGTDANVLNDTDRMDVDYEDDGDDDDSNRQEDGEVVMPPTGPDDAPSSRPRKRKTAVAQRLYCICREPDDGRVMLQCDGCKDWFHPECIGIPSSDADTLQFYFCSDYLGRGLTLAKQPCQGPKCRTPAAYPSKYCSADCGAAHARSQLLPPPPPLQAQEPSQPRRGFDPTQAQLARHAPHVPAFLWAAGANTGHWTESDRIDARAALAAVRGLQRVRNGLRMLDRRLLAVSEHAAALVVFAPVNHDESGGATAMDVDDVPPPSLPRCGYPLTLDPEDGYVGGACDRTECTRHRHWRVVIKARLEVERVSLFTQYREAHAALEAALSRLSLRHQDWARTLFHGVARTAAEGEGEAEPANSQQ